MWQRQYSGTRWGKMVFGVDSGVIEHEDLNQ
jgi:hypothetical protein